MFKNYILLIILSLFTSTVSSQTVDKNTLGLPKYTETDINALKHKLLSAKADTNRVWLLHKIGVVYWYRRSATYNDLDSCVYFANQARETSRRLNFKAGFDESSFLLCRTYVEQDKLLEAVNLIKEVPPAEQVRMQLVIGEYYLFLPGSLKVNVEKARIYLFRALRQATAISSLHWTQEAQIAIGKYYFAAREVVTGASYFMKVIDYYKLKDMKAQEAHWWSDLARYIPSDSAYVLRSYKNALNLYRQVEDQYNVAATTSDIAVVHEMYQDLDQAQYLFLESITLLKKAKIKKLYSYYYKLADVFQRKGDYRQALSYYLLALSNMEELKDERMKGVVYFGIGEIYKGLGQIDKSLHYYNLAMEQLNRSGSYLVHYLAKNITDVMIMQKRYQPALNHILAFEKMNPAIRIRDKETIAAAIGNCYYALNRISTAEKYYLSMISMDYKARQEASLMYSRSVLGPEAFYLISKFYVDQKRFSTAVPYLRKYLEYGAETRTFLKDVMLMRFKVDSATGNYVAAIKHLQKHDALKDSIFNIANSQEMAQMEVRYETRQKEKDIRILQKESQLQQRRLAQSNQLRNFTFAGIVMFGIIIGIGYNRYRIKQSSYNQLQHKQEEINKNNTDLQSLTAKQGKLLEEKEWLIKEIHHRVKNNLQLITSLLKNQMRYIDSEVAIEAIRTSQHRMQAMSLVHTHLYQSENLDIVQMSIYFHELLEFFRANFDLPKRIQLTAEVDDIALDVIQAIPIGLIINEAITNAIKYAFPEQREGRIMLSLKRENDHLILRIADNGVGLNETFEPSASTSFGMKLIEGLCQQIDASVIFRNENGLQIIIQFIQYQL
jgi:two-component sensor histidine kinase